MVFKMIKQGIIGSLTVTICIQLFSLYDLREDLRQCITKGYTISPPCYVPRRPTVIMLNPDTFPAVKIAMTAFSRLGYDMHTRYEQWSGRCDLIWSHKWPFTDDKILGIFGTGRNNIKINHFPGISWIGNKYNFNTLVSGSKYMPKTYRMPRDRDDLLEKISSAGDDSTRHWVVKTSHHRNVSVKASHELDLSTGMIQQFIHNQFLLQGHVISLGIMVVITSVSPLRVYILDNGWMVRIAGKPYQPGNYSDTETFISNGASNNLFEFEPMQKFFKIGYSRSQALFAHMISDLGVPQNKITFIKEQIRHAVLDAVATRSHLLMSPYKNQKNIGTYSSFFEVMRWDFIIDDDMNVYLLEANMSPDLMGTSPMILAKNSNVILSTLSSLGYRYGGRHKNGVRDADINVHLHVCFTGECKNCMHKDCILCPKCLSHVRKQMLRTSLIAHTHQLQLRNVRDKRMNQKEALSFLQEHDFSNMTSRSREAINQIWMATKCVKDVFWCT